MTVAALRGAGVPSPESDARWLVEAVLGSDAPRDTGRGLSADEQRRLTELCARRCAREPLQLIIGTVAFRALELCCRPGVFIPRPETEVLAGLVIDLLSSGPRRDGRPVIVHEPCCGTGAVGLAVADEVEGLVVMLADRSGAAVELAMHNRDLLASAGRLRSPVEVRQGDLLDAFEPSAHGAAAVIVANPPYLPSSDLVDLEPEVVDHDPHDALTGGVDGHEVVDALLRESAWRLVPGGVVVLEIDARRAASAVDVARHAGLVDVEVHRDLTGADRFVLARRPGSDADRR